ncbi:stage V sporulation protein AE [Caldalkalibacillus thermarum TA2.A1]|uniref:Stage V sporulation protein AE n=1 Tax=Caldalkalibacillus thermarum (strain TA2.A1) TaxID=986075 RepID=F5L884_CALTT|nr:stage V sporulation protein AE [Caldalkalibacillus thermarum]EGL82497.1 stage V sporulation protein AE [Caldalkalibacillus thermarum TA2.A1]
MYDKHRDLTAKRHVIMITDGDDVAKQVIEQVAKDIGGRCITLSAGNPTPISGEEIVELILQAKHDPVLVMFDDNGRAGYGAGESAMVQVARHPRISVLGVIAVASNTAHTNCTHVDVAIDAQGRIVEQGVNKAGDVLPDSEKCIFGDTVEILGQLNIPVIVGIGDIGKMKRRDHLCYGAPVTHKAVEIILERSGYYEQANKEAEN